MREMLHSGTACLAMLALASTVAFAAEQEMAPDTSLSTAPSSVAQSDAAKTDAGQPSDVKELSRPPLSHVEYPADRPSWLDQAPNLGEAPHTWVIVTAPAETLDECRDEIALMRRAAVASYIKLKSNSDRFDFYPINDKWIKERLVSRTYQGKVTKGGTEHYEMAVELTFPQEVQSEILTAWDQINVRDRLASMGAVVFTGLTLLICASMLLCMFSRRATREDSMQLAA
ncbi:hypothetical protein [Planctomycetes bacterium K23_9]|uniref:Transmembrane protein n=1 Tax=Stieleria marina TaxID=1930275 RepID=A0A517P2Q5_9BACT|nr:hypothetical protein K239x_56480 [Planctomycetes bacterium K23_9]